MPILSGALLCMALNVYHESRGEGLEGMISVAYATHHQAHSHKDEYCRTVYKVNPTGKAVFSWTTDPHTIPADRKSLSWKNSVAVAKTFKAYPDPTKGATNYHKTTVRPSWRKKMVYLTTIGNHVFYYDPHA